MLETSQKVVDILKNGTEKDFTKLIAVELHVIGKDEEGIAFDFAKIKKYYKEYLNFGTPKFSFIEQSNSSSQKTVQIIFHTRISKSTTDYDVRLDLMFGPPQLFSLHKISGYKIIDKIDVLYPTQDR